MLGSSGSLPDAIRPGTSRLGTQKVGTVSMKVQLIVVQGKPEGKMIPLVGPIFKIGRGETCHLRPNSEQVSREHAEFTVDDRARCCVRDLGQPQRHAGQRQGADRAVRAEGRDLVQVGPLTFAVSIEACRAAAQSDRGRPAQAKAASPDDVSSRRDRVVAGRRQRQPHPRAPLRRLRRRHDHDHRLQGRGVAQADPPAPAAGSRRRPSRPSRATPTAKAPTPARQRRRSDRHEIRGRGIRAAPEGEATTTSR